MILLTEEEIDKAFNEHPEYTQNSIRRNAVARAQLKKVYELVSPYLYDTRGGWILESLKKEAGG